MWRGWLLGIMLVIGGTSSLSLFAKTDSEQVPSTYTVKKGDTLWDISAHFFANPMLWPKLWHKNPYIKDPDLIYPGDQLHLSWHQGQPRLTHKPMRKLAPQIKVITRESTELSSGVMLPFLSHHQLISTEQLASLPHIVAEGQQLALMSSRDIWADAALTPEQRWRVYRVKQTLSRAATEGKPSQDIVLLQQVAVAKVAVATDTQSRLTLLEQQQELRQNDVLLPMFPPTKSTGITALTPNAEIQASVLTNLKQTRYIAKQDLVVIDRGADDALRVGDVLKLYDLGAKVDGKRGDYRYSDGAFYRDTQTVPSRALGELMVVNTYPDFSLALITNAIQPLKQGIQALSL